MALTRSIVKMTCWIKKIQKQHRNDYYEYNIEFI